MGKREVVIEEVFEFEEATAMMNTDLTGKTEGQSQAAGETLRPGTLVPVATNLKEKQQKQRDQSRKQSVDRKTVKRAEAIVSKGLPGYAQALQPASIYRAQAEEGSRGCI